MEYRELFEKAESAELVGHFKKIPDEVYRKCPGLSQTVLKEMGNSPAHAKVKQDEVDDSKPTVPWLTHIAINEPERFATKIAHVENRMTKANKELIKQAEAMGKIVCRTNEYEEAIAIRDAVRKQAGVMQFIDGAQTEVSAFAKLDWCKLQLKGRYDLYHPDQNLIVDLKFISRGMSDFAIEKLVMMRSWHLQAWYYSFIEEQITGKKPEFLNIMVEDKPPYGARVYKINEASLEKAAELYQPLIKDYAECYHIDEWPCFTPAIRELSLPGYAWSQEEPPAEERYMEGGYHG